MKKKTKNKKKLGNGVKYDCILKSAEGEGIQIKKISWD